MSKDGTADDMGFKRPLSQNMLILGALEELGTAPAYIIARYVGVENKLVNGSISRLVGLGRVSRTEKPKGGGYYKYFLNDKQRDAYYRLLGEVPRGGLNGVNVVTAADRLRFLRGLNERSVYAGNPVLVSIITDYERTLKTGAGTD